MNIPAFDMERKKSCHFVNMFLFACEETLSTVGSLAPTPASIYTSLSCTE